MIVGLAQFYVDDFGIWSSVAETVAHAAKSNHYSQRYAPFMLLFLC